MQLIKKCEMSFGNGRMKPYKKGNVIVFECCKTTESIAHCGKEVPEVFNKKTKEYNIICECSPDMLFSYDKEYRKQMMS